MRSKDHNLKVSHHADTSKSMKLSLKLTFPVFSGALQKRIPFA